VRPRPRAQGGRHRALLRVRFVLLLNRKLRTRFEFETGDGFFSLLLAVTYPDLASVAASNEMLAVELLLVAISAVAIADREAAANVTATQC
jgi:hypothetical protein